jgi:polyisoprenyl-teichoic acid--peptidoglycan teichoic acid transferase
VANLTCRMSLEDKPYRVYRGGRVKGKVPTLPKPERGARQRNGRQPGRYTGPAPARVRRRRSWKLYVIPTVLVLLALIAVWAVASYLAVRDGVRTANERLGQPARAALTPQDGSALTHPTHVLLLGTDSAPTAARRGLRHTDSIMLVRSDPDHNRVAYLSIPRDLRVDVPGRGFDKVNVAFQIGGAPLAIRTIRGMGLPVNHVAIIDLARFKDLIDAVGGVDVNVPRPVLSKFECPLKTDAQCAKWSGWHFRKGKQHMDGRRARIYTRVRKNLLNPADSDISRGARQQQVLQALTDKMTSFGTLLKMPWVGDELAKPLATDLSTADFLELGWRRFRAGDSHTLPRRPGGTPSGFGYLIPEGDDQREVIRQFEGLSAPQPPAPGNLFAPGCRTGRTLLAAG